MKQQTFAAGDFECVSEPTRREPFLAEMEKAVPWENRCQPIEPFCSRSGNGRPLVALELMLCVYFLQHWFSPSVPCAEEALSEYGPVCTSIGIDPGREPVPDETTILNFRHLLTCSFPAGRS